MIPTNHGSILLTAQITTIEGPDGPESVDFTTTVVGFDARGVPWVWHPTLLVAVPFPTLRRDLDRKHEKELFWTSRILDA